MFDTQYILWKFFFCCHVGGRFDDDQMCVLNSKRLRIPGIWNLATRLSQHWQEVLRKINGNFIIYNSMSTHVVAAFVLWSSHALSAYSLFKSYQNSKVFKCLIAPTWAWYVSLNGLTYMSEDFLFFFSALCCLHLSVTSELMNNERLDVNGWGFLFRGSAVAGISWNTPRIFHLSGW